MIKYMYRYEKYSQIRFETMHGIHLHITDDFSRKFAMIIKTLYCLALSKWILRP